MTSPLVRKAALKTLLAALVFCGGAAQLASARTTSDTYENLPQAQRAMVADLEQRTFQWFWDSANPANGLIPDHYPGPSFSSIASVGFGLTAYGVGVERGYVTREQAVDRTLT
ncbi:MAG TPA: hypothetical protein VJP80_01335, partial [Candidatus Saccharimonadales bacterium]|nr:hypothetical protein [Candidatus Saccharimonadales bacterium]